MDPGIVKDVLFAVIVMVPMCGLIVLMFGAGEIRHPITGEVTQSGLGLSLRQAVVLGLALLLGPFLLCGAVSPREYFPSDVSYLEGDWVYGGVIVSDVRCPVRTSDAEQLRFWKFPWWRSQGVVTLNPYPKETLPWEARAERRSM